MKLSLKPTQVHERIQSLDIIRGIAILGILIMNIQSFSMPGSAYSNPMAFGDLSGINKWVWIISHVFADMKFMNIFSILFGAGIILVTSKSEMKTGKSAVLHYKRTIWLLIIGLFHAHLIWYGDILVIYALCALILYPLRNIKPSIQLLLGLIIFSIQSIMYLFFGATLGEWPADSLTEMAQSWAPTQERINFEIGMITGNLSQQIQFNSAVATYLETNFFVSLYGFWRVSGLMMIGMALYKLGFFTAYKSNAYYFNADWNWEYSRFLGFQFNYWGSLFLCIAYISILMIFVNSNILKSLKNRFAAVGRMALTNYISQSIICTLLFFGIGFGLFGQFDRWLQIIVVLIIWIMQLIWSKPWLKKFRFGPLEWLWRSFTYGKKQKFIK